MLCTKINIFHSFLNMPTIIRNLIIRVCLALSLVSIHINRVFKFRLTIQGIGQLKQIDVELPEFSAQNLKIET